MALPDWLEPLPDAERMRATDRWAIEERGVPSLELMERAGGGLAELTDDVAPTGPVVVLCGGGNNGGDGFVVARLLRHAGREARVAVTTELEAFKGDAKANLERLPGDPPVPFSADVLDGAAVCVDALLGTGFSGDVREPVRSAILALNASGAPVVACDVPSGVDASTGAVDDVAVEAVATATFHRSKPGLWIAPGKQHAGDVHVIEIGIPPGERVEPDVGLIGDRAFDAIPRRASDSTKFSSGHVLVVGGSTGLTGAPCMAAEAAMRAGAGYVTCCVPASLNLVFETRLLEVMTIPLPDADGALTADGLERVLEEASKRGGALVAGPGFGKSDGAFALARDVAARAEVPLVLDADGLNAHAGRLEDLRSRRAATILTPHGGELARLMEVESDAVNARRLEHAREAARASGAIVVLKGDDTLVAAPDGRVAVSPGGVPALATAGTGDVLSGIVAALLAKGLDPFAAAAAGVLSHLHAGAAAAQRRSPDAVIASDVIEALGRPR
ncbi:MAG TPA: NAD(P)H-hydrate dehydratase [Solirubrobacteraceae bacterium]|jgi:NAD(P)H-hydrate epimerase